MQDYNEHAVLISHLWARRNDSDFDFVTAAITDVDAAQAAAVVNTLSGRRHRSILSDLQSLQPGQLEWSHLLTMITDRTSAFRKGPDCGQQLTTHTEESESPPSVGTSSSVTVSAPPLFQTAFTSGTRPAERHVAGDNIPLSSQSVFDTGISFDLYALPSWIDSRDSWKKQLIA